MGVVVFTLAFAGPAAAGHHKIKLAPGVDRRTAGGSQNPARLTHTLSHAEEANNVMSIIRRTYDHGYFQTALHRSSPDSQRNHRRLQIILGYHQNGRLLEIGPGTGEFLRLASSCFDVEGIDISSHAVARAHPDLSDRIRVGNIEQTPLAPGTYQVIAAFNILEHLREPAAVIQRTRQALLHTGCLVGSVPCNSGPVGRVYTQVTNFFDRTHCSTLAPDQWRALFLTAGFSTIRFFGEQPVGPHYSLHIHGRHWQHISPNMMFVCQ
mgnify:FL=1